MWRGSLKLPAELMALSNEQWRWIMRRDNEHCEVIIQDKLVEYQRIHTWNGPGCAHVSRCSKVHIENATHSLQDDHPAKMFKIHHWLCPGIALIAHSSQPHRSKAWTANQHFFFNIWYFIAKKWSWMKTEKIVENVGHQCCAVCKLLGFQFQLRFWDMKTLKKIQAAPIGGNNLDRQKLH